MHKSVRDHVPRKERHRPIDAFSSTFKVLEATRAKNLKVVIYLHCQFDATEKRWKTDLLR